MTQQFSPNMLKTFNLCHKKYEFKYIKGISMPVNDEVFETGKNIHALASYYLRKENIYKMELALNPNEKLLWDYLKNIKYFSYECIATEYNLATKLGNHFFGGRLDALVKDNEKYYILDYKTGNAPKNPEYDFQTIVYLLCVKEFYHTDNVSFVYIDLKNKKEVTIELTQALAEEYKNKLISVAEKIDNEDFSCSTSQNTCENCEFSIICYH